MYSIYFPSLNHRGLLSQLLASACIAKCLWWELFSFEFSIFPCFANSTLPTCWLECCCSECTSILMIYHIPEYHELNLILFSYFPFLYVNIWFATAFPFSTMFSLVEISVLWNFFPGYQISVVNLISEVSRRIYILFSRLFLD